ncbi:MAG: GIY-YIG nuclease family protein [Parcubacteria group bacterium]|nr:GIY-YIG nuclease family protein [Parcubacteria group bacterium]
MPWVYILKSVSYKKTYTGSTADLERRLTEHNAGWSVFSSRYRPWVIVYREEYPTLEEARKREKYLKSSAGRRFIKNNKLILFNL